MASTPLPPDDGEHNSASGPLKGLRLSDAERIAAERLEGVAGGSLEEALAAVGDKADAGPTLAEGAHAVGDGFPAEPAPNSLVVRGELPSPEPGVDRAPVPPADGAADAERAARSAGNSPTVAGVTLETPAPHAAEDTGLQEKMQPLTSAFDAAARLAADANAAAEALENLRRLLERQLPNVAASSPASAPRADGDTASATEGPPPLPAQPLRRVDDADGQPEPEPQLPVPLPSLHVPAERQRLDVRGFLAGFALSCAFGVVLYLFMTAG